MQICTQTSGVRTSSGQPTKHYLVVVELLEPIEVDRHHEVDLAVTDVPTTKSRTRRRSSRDILEMASSEGSVYTCSGSWIQKGGSNGAGVPFSGVGVRVASTPD